MIVKEEFNCSNNNNNNNNNNKAPRIENDNMKTRVKINWTTSLCWVRLFLGP